MECLNVLHCWSCDKVVFGCIQFYYKHQNVIYKWDDAIGSNDTK